jgi:hypothetical protein
MRHLCLPAVCLAGLWLAAAPDAAAQASPASPRTPAPQAWQWGAVLDVAATSRALELGQRGSGWQLGHSDIGGSGPLGRYLSARVTAVLATQEGELEREIEEAWIETTRLPGGWQLRGGRFASQIGALNAQHRHADDFTERPLLYRAFLGSDWNDDGLRINWTAPTPFYLMLGAEAFAGKRLVHEAQSGAPRVGVWTLAAKLGADVSRAHSWQLGLALVRNKRQALVEAHEDEVGHEGGHEEAGHDDHGARFSGRRMQVVDFTWKWAPEGNNRNQQIKMSVEAARISGLAGLAGAPGQHRAQALAVVYRFHPSWEVGARLDRLRVLVAHEDDSHPGRLDERSVMLVWKPSHQQSLRLQFSQQHHAVAFEHPARRSVQLQYVLAFGAHSAHSY